MYTPTRLTPTDATSGTSSTRRTALAVLVASAALGLGACGTTDAASEVVVPADAATGTVNDTTASAVALGSEPASNSEIGGTGTAPASDQSLTSDSTQPPDTTVPAVPANQPVAGDSTAAPPAPPTDSNGQPAAPPTDSNGQPAAPPTDANGQPAAPPSGQMEPPGQGGPGGGFSATSATSAADLNSMLSEAVGDGGLGLHRGHQPIQETLTTVLGISHEELHVRMEQQGQNLAAVATDLGIDPQTLIDALVAAWNPTIETIESSGAITADQAEQYRQALVDAFTFRVDWNGTDAAPTFNVG